jgi:hypothetical protein
VAPARGRDITARLLAYDSLNFHEDLNGCPKL